MELVKLGKKGQLSIPKTILAKVGIPADSPVLLDTTDDGAIVIRPAAVYPVEVYSAARIEEFLAADTPDADQAMRLRELEAHEG